MTDPADHWYENAVVYAIDVEAFQDSEGDGVGDFPGLVDRLDHLDRLGVDCLWLLPFYPTPNRDNGYDVADYYDVDPRHGTLGDFVEFVEAAQRRNLRVLIDLVVNHTSDQHPWFQRSRRNPDSKYRDYYVWSREPPAADPARGTVFPGEVPGDRVWTYDSTADAYYHHRFYPFQPDLDLRNPDVREEIRRIVRFWLDLGVDGFRVDAATLMLQGKRPGAPEPSDPHELLRELRSYASRHGGDVVGAGDPVLLAEADDEPGTLASYFGDGDEMDLLFNFVLNAHLFLALAVERGEPIERGLSRLPDTPEGGGWLNFLRNYDELNVGRLPWPDRRAVYERFAPEADSRIYGRGIRRRLAPMLDGDRQWLALAFSLLFSMPGAPLLVYGDELGMGDDQSLPGRSAVRTPMQWSADRNAGFSTAAPEALVRPVVAEGPFSYERVNVADARADDGSLFNFVRRLVRARRATPEVGRGRPAVLATQPDGAFAHRYDRGDATVAFAHNLAADPLSVTLDVDPDGASLRELLGDGEVSREPGALAVDLPGRGLQWLRLERG